MLNKIQLNNKLDWQNLGQINLIIGENQCGKSHILKKSYQATLEQDGYDPERVKFLTGGNLFRYAQGKRTNVFGTYVNTGRNTIFYIDDVETGLHPKAISDLLDIIAVYARHGVQFFMTSHSYFVIKKLFLIAQQNKMSIPVLSYQDGKWVQSDLLKDIADNPIIDESIRLYEEYLNLE